MEVEVVFTTMQQQQTHIDDTTTMKHALQNTSGRLSTFLFKTLIAFLTTTEGPLTLENVHSIMDLSTLLGSGYEFSSKQLDQEREIVISSHKNTRKDESCYVHLLAFGDSQQGTRVFVTVKIGRHFSYTQFQIGNIIHVKLESRPAFAKLEYDTNLAIFSRCSGHFSPEGSALRAVLKKMGDRMSFCTTGMFGVLNYTMHHDGHRVSHLLSGGRHHALRILAQATTKVSISLCAKAASKVVSSLPGGVYQVENTYVTNAEHGTTFILTAYGLRGEVVFHGGVSNDPACTQMLFRRSVTDNSLAVHKLTVEKRNSDDCYQGPQIKLYLNKITSDHDHRLPFALKNQIQNGHLIQSYLVSASTNLVRSYETYQNLISTEAVRCPGGSKLTTYSHDCYGDLARTVERFLPTENQQLKIPNVSIPSEANWTKTFYKQGGVLLGRVSHYADRHNIEEVIISVGLLLITVRGKNTIGRDITVVYDKKLVYAGNSKMFDSDEDEDDNDDNSNVVYDCGKAYHVSLYVNALSEIYGTGQLSNDETALLEQLGYLDRDRKAKRMLVTSIFVILLDWKAFVKARCERNSKGHDRVILSPTVDLEIDFRMESSRADDGRIIIDRLVTVAPQEYDSNESGTSKKSPVQAFISGVRKVSKSISQIFYRGGKEDKAIQTGEDIADGMIVKTASKEKGKEVGEIVYKAGRTADDKHCVITLFIPQGAIVDYDKLYDKYRTNKARVMSVKRVLYNKEHQVYISDLNTFQQCVVCWTEDTQNLAAAKECHHIMCAGCWKDILKHDGHCPLCRAQVTRVYNLPENYRSGESELAEGYSCVYTRDFVYQVGTELEVRDYQNVENNNPTCLPGIYFSRELQDVFKWFLDVPAGFLSDNAPGHITADLENVVIQ